MPKQYTKDATLNAFLHPSLTEGKIANLYSKGFLNWTGFVKGGDESYTEIIASHLLLPQNLDILEKTPCVSREASYNIGHDHIPYDPSSKISGEREEERRARNMLGNIYSGIEKIIDYQIPLKNVRNDGTDRKIGKIDLLSYNEKENCVYIIEYKRPDSPETLLRCVLEIHTYWCTVDKKKLLRDYEYAALDPLEIRKAVLVYQNCQAFNDFKAAEKSEAVRELMKKLRVSFFVLNDDDKDIIEQESHKWETL